MSVRKLTMAGAMAALMCVLAPWAVHIGPIIVMYFYREEKAKSMLFGTAVLVISNVLEIFALVDIVFVAKYNKERGLNLKYVFYLFYPVHMLVLYLIAYCMGLIV